MPKVALYNIEGKEIGEIELKDEIFAVEISSAALHMTVKNYLANQRQGTQSTKTRTEVSGGGAKPWKQKGTGRARQGSIRAPQWKGGGVALGPKPRDYSYTLNKKTRRLALKSALSSKVAENNIIVVDKLAMDEIKTKSFVKILEN
ncbi:MAG: 50S ribosomal protein L4, partial [Clostridia bacterium]|nr:50S ribosomal protein L4 [Clostridia bacterium]